MTHIGAKRGQPKSKLHACDPEHSALGSSRNIIPLMETNSRATYELLDKFREFCFPSGEEAGRDIIAVRTAETGRIRATPEAHWIPFSAKQVIQANRSAFQWEARFNPGKLTSPTVVDAYDNSHGRLSIKLAGVIPVKKVYGPEADRGELQRYLASVVFCPPMLLNHPSLSWTIIEDRILRVRDTADPSGATVDLEISDDGRPVICRAERPRIIGNKAILTPWSAKPDQFQTFEGLRVPTRLEVAWHLPEGSFTYYQSKLEGITVSS